MLVGLRRAPRNTGSYVRSILEAPLLCFAQRRSDSHCDDYIIWALSLQSSEASRRAVCQVRGDLLNAIHSGYSLWSGSCVSGKQGRRERWFRAGYFINVPLENSADDRVK